jgi:hypothetical protein
MSVGNIRKLEQRFLQTDGKITTDAAKELIKSAKDGGFLGIGNVTKEEKAELQAILARDADKLEPSAADELRRFLQIKPPALPPQPISVVTGSNPADFSDDKIFFGPDGSLHGETGVSSYTRSYDSTKAGPLRSAHGSPAPESKVLTADENAAAKVNTPGKGLDAAAAAFGVKVDGFEKMANSKDFYDENAEFWWGKCHAWTWSSLDNKVNKLVDVDGPDNQKGVWIAGNWMSRADLGNWMMATADTISLNDDRNMFKDNLSATDLVKGTMQFLTNNGGGVVSDVYNDKKKGDRQVWNQPFVSSDFTTKSMSGPAAEALLKQAKADGVEFGSQVKQITIVGTYGVEVGDDHEGDPGRSSKTWQVYGIADATGKLLTAYMADDEKLKDIADLPTKYSDDVPEYFWKPTLAAVEDTLAGKSNSVVDNNEHGAEFKFFLNTVLSKGVSGQERSAFETRFQALPAGPIDAATAQQLAKDFPGVANAYSPEQWKNIFQARGLDAKTFGAAWKPVS